MEKKKLKFGLLPRILVAIVLGIALGGVIPQWLTRVFVTFNGVFSNLLGFLIPLIIVGLVTPAIGNIGKRAGRLLLITVLIAYGDTVFAGLFSLFGSTTIFPSLISPASAESLSASAANEVAPYFNIDIPAMFDVMSALVFAFVVGLGIAHFFHTDVIRHFFDEFKEIISRTIQVVIVPVLPLYIFGIFLKMSAEGQAMGVVKVFLAVICVIFAMHIILLLLQFCVAGAVAGRNPFKSLWTMMPAYITALGTSSSAATIPVTLECVNRNDVDERISEFTVPLCATIHLSGSTLKITSCAVALMIMQGMNIDFVTMLGFILMLGVMMVAAPGVPGGAIMAALGVLQSILGFDQSQQALMIALYIAMDSFGTACNVTGDGAIAMVVNRLNH